MATSSNEEIIPFEEPQILKDKIPFTHKWWIRLNHRLSTKQIKAVSTFDGRNIKIGGYNLNNAYLCLELQGSRNDMNAFIQKHLEFTLLINNMKD